MVIYMYQKNLLKCIKHKLFQGCVCNSILRFIRRAYMITPNQIEAELLTGIAIRTEVDVIEALKRLHKQGPHVVSITSTALQDTPGMYGYYYTV